MFGTIKKAMAVGAVVVVGAFAAPAVAGADVWSHTGAAHAEGELTLTLDSSGATTTCDVTATLDLDNTGGVAGGLVTSFFLGQTIPGGGPNCQTSIPNCAVHAFATGLPWTITTSGTDVTIGGVSFVNHYSGPNCPVNGLTVTANGNVTGSVIPGTNEIEFNSAPISTTAGDATVDGSVFAYAEDEEGGPNYDTPVELVE